jgi:hypothetical protein
LLSFSNNGWYSYNTPEEAKEHTEHMKKEINEQIVHRNQ